MAPSASPRIAPGTPAEIGPVNQTIAWLLGLAAGGGPPHVFTTLARHRRLFRRWLRFAGALMPGGILPRQQTELLILRVAHNCGCVYEWGHHARLGRAAGLSAEDVERVRRGPDEQGWSQDQQLLLRAADEMHEHRTISDGLWERLRPAYTDPELIEICMLVGHYEMLAMTLNALAVAPDAPASGPSSAAALVLRAMSGRSAPRHGSGG